MSLEKKYFFVIYLFIKLKKATHIYYMCGRVFVQVNGSDLKNGEDPNYACCLLKFANT